MYYMMQLICIQIAQMAQYLEIFIFINIIQVRELFLLLRIKKEQFNNNNLTLILYIKKKFII